MMKQLLLSQPYVAGSRFFAIGALLIGAWAWSFWSTLESMELVWRGSETYMHCYFIPLISAWLIWPLRQAINIHNFGSKWGLFCLLPSLLLWLVGFAADVNLIAHFAAMLCLISILWCWLGNENFRVLRFPLLYLLFAVPFGDEANAPLQFVTAEMAVWLLQMTGIPVLHEGLYITTPVASFEVAEACSGVRFMIVALALAFLFSHMHFKSWKKRALFISSMIVLSIIANSFRAFFLIFIGEKSGMEYGFGADHYYYGWGFFAIAIFLAFHLGAKFSDDNDQKPTSVINSTARQSRPILLTALLLLGLNIGLYSAWQPVETPAAPAQLAPPKNWLATATNRLSPKFPFSLASSSAINSAGLEYYTAHFAARQTQGELIGWDTQLFDKEHWRVTQQIDLTIAGGQWREVELKRGPTQQVVLYYSYQVGSNFTTDNKKVKLQQAIQFISVNRSQAILHHINCIGDVERCRPSVMSAVPELIALH